MASGDVNKTGTGFVNLDQYLNANKNNDLENTVSSGLQNDTNQVNTGLQNAQNQFTSAANSGRLDNSQNQQEASDILNQGQNVTAGTPLSQQQIQDFGNLRSGSYTGPQDLTNYGLGNLTSQAQNVQQAANAAGTSSGRQGLLQNYVGGPGYTAGEQGLDNLLLGASNGTQLQKARQGASGLTNSLNQQNTNDQNLAQTYSNYSNQFAQQNQNAANQALNNYGNSLNNQVTGANNAQNTAYGNLVSQLQNPGSLTQAQIDQINASNPGLGLKEGQNLYGVNLLQGVTPTTVNGVNTYTNGQYLSENSPLGLQNIVTPDIAARANALSALSGQANPLGNLDPNNLPTGYNTAANTPAYSFSTGLNTALQNAQQNYTSAENAPLSGLTGNNAAFNGMTPQQAQIVAQNAQVQFSGIDPTNIPAQQAAQVAALNQILAQRNQTLNSQYGGSLGQPTSQLGIGLTNPDGTPVTKTPLTNTGRMG